MERITTSKCVEISDNSIFVLKLATERIVTKNTYGEINNSDEQREFVSNLRCNVVVTRGHR